MAPDLDIDDYPLSGKFQTVEDAVWMPFKCASCGWSNAGNEADGREQRRQFITWNMEVDYYGIIYLCYTCAKEVGQSAGLPTVQQFTNLADEYMTTLSEKSELVIRVDDLENVVRAIPRMSELLNIPDRVDVNLVKEAEKDEPVRSDDSSERESLPAHRETEQAQHSTGRDHKSAMESFAFQGPVHVSESPSSFGV